MPTAFPPTLVPRILAGGVVQGHVGGPGGGADFESDWGGIRATQRHLAAQELPEGSLVNNLLALNLGGETCCESNLGGRGWRSHRSPHHGVTVVPAGLSYSARTPEGADFLLVEVPPDFVTLVLGGGKARALPLVLGARDAFAEHVLLALAEEGRRGARSAVLAESLGTALVTHFAERVAAAEPAPALFSLPSPQLRAVLEFIARRLDTPLTLKQLASLAGMDLFRFARGFKQSTGSSPHRYVLEARIARAKELLRDRTIPITEIAFQTGFATPSHFSVTFRRITSLTPRAFRDGGP